MASVNVNLSCDLQHPVRVQYLDGNLFSMDNGGNTINIMVYDNGEPAEIGGSVTANVIRADGGTVAVSGAIDGNRAYVILSQACYAVPGALSVIIKLTEETTVTTIAAFVANVYQSSTDETIDPGTIIPSVENLISEIESAIADIPVGYNASFAPAYSTSKTYAIGQYVTYNGYLWRCTTAITSAESWTSSHWTQVALAEDVSNLKSAIKINSNRAYNALNRLEPSFVSVFDFEQGGLSTNGINTDENSAYRVRSACFIPVEQATYSFYIGNNSGMDFSVSYYTSDDPAASRTGYQNWTDTSVQDAHLITIPSGVKYIRFLIRYRNDSFTTPLPLSTFQQLNVYFQKTNFGLNIQRMYYSKGNLYADTGYINRDAISIITPLLNTGAVLLPKNATALISFWQNGAYIGKLNQNLVVDKVAGSWARLTGKVDIDELLEKYSASHLIVAIMTTDTTDPMTASNYAAWGDRNVCFTNEKKVVAYLEQEIYGGGTDYVIPADFTKRSVKVTNTGKQILGWQSFCKYGNVYYSYTDSTFYKQDENFDLIAEFDDFDLGHGNSLQLGSSKYAFASGWDDNKVYKVDLENVTIADTISLPVSGYTTCAVDDVNGIMYIFYRSTYPSTVDTYEFIVWDYINNRIISRKYINSFAAMQSCDYYNGRIIVAYGLSNTETGLTVYNTVGDILASYHLTVLSGNEPEGVFFDRGSGVLYFSDLGKVVYTIT